jgi:hypothetical protein
MKKATLQKPFPCVPLTVDAAWADPGNPIMPAGTAMVIVPRALAFKNVRRFSALLARLEKAWPP